jgi:putative spermidine/putrescine transport system ATP-binding protein
MIAGFDTVTAGQILLDGQPIANLPPYKRNIGMVFQSYSLFPHMTVFDNVAYPLRRRHQSAETVRLKVQEALEMVQLGELNARFPKELSGGQQQRVALARAIVFSPRVLLMDEPFGALDKKLREHLQIEIKRLHRELGMTFVFVTHDQEEALILSDRIAVFNKGKIVQVGPAEELYDHPKDLFVADFIGDSNIFAGQVQISAGDPSLSFAGVSLAVPHNSNVESGVRASLVVRPERIAIRAPSGAISEGEVAIKVRISQIIYIGSRRKVVAKLPNGTELTATIGAGEAIEPSENGEVWFVWPRSAGVLLPGLQ